jgi:hypothetical protein
MKGWMLAAGGLALAMSVWAGDAWKDKKPADWTEKDLTKFLTRSPWAKSVAMEMDFSRMSRNRSGRGGIGGEMPGGGVPGDGAGAGPMGGRGGGMGGPGGGGRGPGGGMAGGGMGEGGMEGGGMPAPPPAIVRWESAPLVREANARAESQEFNEAVAKFAKDYYVVSVTIAAPERPGGWPGGGGGWGGRQDSGAMDERHKQMTARLVEATSIKAGGEARPPERVEVLKSVNGRTTLFLFPRALALEGAAKELNFETALGPMVIKAKFNPKEMAQGSIPGF